MPPMPKPEPRAHEKMVDLDNDKDIEPPPDAKYLAQKNNRADVETRATDTNLAEGAEGGGRGVGEVGSRRHRGRRRQAEDRRARGQEVGAGPQGARRHAARQPGGRPAGPGRARAEVAAGAARSAPRSQHELTPETADLSLPHAADGEVAQPRPPVRGANSDPSRQKNGERVKLALSRQGLRVPVRRRRRGRAPARADADVDAAGEVPAQRRARAGRAGELHPGGQARQPDRAQHARRAVRRLHREDAPEHPQAVGLRRARGLGRAVRLEPAQQPEPRRPRSRWC